MSQLKCEVIRDLLPLYVDDICSNESRRLVSDHMEHCEACRQLHANLTVPMEQHTPDPELDSKTAFRSWNSRLRTLGRIISVLLILLSLVAFSTALTVTGSGFLDLSNLAKIVLGGISVTCVCLAALAWKTEEREGRKTKLIVVLITIVTIIAIIYLYDITAPPAVELTP